MSALARIRAAVLRLEAAGLPVWFRAGRLRGGDEVPPDLDELPSGLTSMSLPSGLSLRVEDSRVAAVSFFSGVCFVGGILLSVAMLVTNECPGSYSGSGFALGGCWLACFYSSRPLAWGDRRLSDRLGTRERGAGYRRGRNRGLRKLLWSGLSGENFCVRAGF
jgi:hypothetical protein